KPELVAKALNLAEEVFMAAKIPSTPPDQELGGSRLAGYQELMKEWIENGYFLDKETEQDSLQGMINLADENGLKPYLWNKRFKDVEAAFRKSALERWQKLLTSQNLDNLEKEEIDTIEAGEARIRLDALGTLFN